MMGNGTTKDIWVWVRATRDGIGEETHGLIEEARRLLFQSGHKGTITALTDEQGLDEELLRGLGSYGADRVMIIPGGPDNASRGEYNALALSFLAGEESPDFFLMVQDQETVELAARLAARLEAPLATRAVDLKWTETDQAVAVRPISNGYLFEERAFSCHGTSIVCFLPQVLNRVEAGAQREAEILEVEFPDLSPQLRIRILEQVEADPRELGIEESDIVVSGGRGAGKGEQFEVLHELAEAIGGTVGGTRPVIDLEILPFERQIGQTGKTVTPRLLFACGISGANEYTAGMEKSQRVIAVNTDPRARIFRFADLGVVGDVREILPLLIARIKEREKKG